MASNKKKSMERKSHGNSLSFSIYYIQQILLALPFTSNWSELTKIRREKARCGIRVVTKKEFVILSKRKI